MASRALGVALALLALLPAGAVAAPSSAALQQALEESLAGQPGSPGMIAAVGRGRYGMGLYCPRRGVAISVTVNAAPPVPSAPPRTGGST